MITREDITFYIVNHIEVLGFKRGVAQVSRRLAFNKDFVKKVYLEEKKKDNQMAV